MAQKRGTQLYESTYLLKKENSNYWLGFTGYRRCLDQQLEPAATGLSTGREKRQHYAHPKTCIDTAGLLNFQGRHIQHSSRSCTRHRAEERLCATAGNKPESHSHVHAQRAVTGGALRSRTEEKPPPPRTTRSPRAAAAAAALTVAPTGPGAAREPLPGRHLLGTMATRLPRAGRRPCRKSLRRYRGNGRFRGGGLREAAPGSPPRPSSALPRSAARSGRYRLPHSASERHLTTAGRRALRIIAVLFS